MNKWDLKQNLPDFCSVHLEEATKSHQKLAAEEVVLNHARGPLRDPGSSHSTAKAAREAWELSVRQNNKCNGLGFAAAAHPYPAANERSLSAFLHSLLPVPEPSSSRPMLMLPELIWNLLIFISKEIK